MLLIGYRSRVPENLSQRVGGWKSWLIRCGIAIEEFLVLSVEELK